MHHCVASYTAPAGSVRPRSGPWGSSEPGDRKGVLTIELNPSTREIQQASMACNELPDDPSRAHLERWAAQEGLTLTY